MAKPALSNIEWDVALERLRRRAAQVAEAPSARLMFASTTPVSPRTVVPQNDPGHCRTRSSTRTSYPGLQHLDPPRIEGMRERGFGRIMATLARSSARKDANAGQVNFSASQAGDLGFTKALAQENANKGVTVNAICPGYIATEMVMAVPKDVLEKSILPQIAVHRLGQPEEVARCVVFLASDDAGYITGSTLSANGGQAMI